MFFHPAWQTMSKHPGIIKRKFIFGTDEEFGYNGFIPTWIPNANAVQGLTIAHDVLEHAPCKLGGFEGEMQASGCMQWLRADVWSNRYSTLNQAQANDIETFFGWVLDGRETIKSPGARLIKTAKSTEFFDYADMQGLIKPAILASFSNYGVEPEEFPLSLDEISSRILGWMHQGATRAAQYYGRWNMRPIYTWYLFEQLEQGFDAKYRNEYEPGTELTVTVNLETEEIEFSLDEDIVYRRGY